MKSATVHGSSKPKGKPSAVRDLWVPALTLLLCLAGVGVGIWRLFPWHHDATQLKFRWACYKTHAMAGSPIGHEHGARCCWQCVLGAAICQIQELVHSQGQYKKCWIKYWIVWCSLLVSVLWCLSNALPPYLLLHFAALGDAMLAPACTVARYSSVLLVIGAVVATWLLIP